MDEDDDEIDDNDDESVGSDTALQSREPLKVKDEEWTCKVCAVED